MWLGLTGQLCWMGSTYSPTFVTLRQHNLIAFTYALFDKCWSIVNNHLFQGNKMESAASIWECLEPSSGLACPERTGHAAVYCASKDCVYVFGGHNESAAADLWKFQVNNRQWQQVHIVGMEKTES